MTTVDGTIESNVKLDASAVGPGAEVSLSARLAETNHVFASATIPVFEARLVAQFIKYDGSMFMSTESVSVDKTGPGVQISIEDGAYVTISLYEAQVFATILEKEAAEAEQGVEP